MQHGGHRSRGVSPGGRRADAAERREGCRDDERDLAVVARLLVGEVAQPRGQECVAVVEEARGGREDLDVAGPAEPLVTLRAVGGDRQEVAAHAPHDVLVQAVEHLVRRREPPGAGHVGVQHDGLDVGRVDLETRDLGVAEAVEREAGLQGLVAARQVERRGGRGVAQRADAELPVFEHLGVAHHDALPRGAARADPQAADEILTEVEDRAARGCRDRGDDGDRVDAAHRRCDPRFGHRYVLVVGLGGRADTRRRPLGVTGGGDVTCGGRICGKGSSARHISFARLRRQRPAGLCKTQILVLAGVDAAVHDRSVAERLPAIAGRGERLDSAVDVGHPQLCEERGLRAVQTVGEVEEPVLLGVPGAGDGRAEHVLALAHERGHIDRLVHEPVAVARPSGREHVVGDGCAVELRFGSAERRPEQGRRADRPVEREGGADQGRLRVPRGIGESDRLRDPFAVGEEAGRDADRVAPCRFGSVGRPDTHGDIARLPRRERGEGPRDEHAVTAGDGDRRCAVGQVCGILYPPRLLGSDRPAQSRRRGRDERGVVAQLGAQR